MTWFRTFWIPPDLARLGVRRVLPADHEAATQPVSLFMLLWKHTNAPSGGFCSRQAFLVTFMHNSARWRFDTRDRIRTERSERGILPNVNQKTPFKLFNRVSRHVSFDENIFWFLRTSGVILVLNLIRTLPAERRVLEGFSRTKLRWAFGDRAEANRAVCWILFEFMQQRQELAPRDWIFSEGSAWKHTKKNHPDSFTLTSQPRF